MGPTRVSPRLGALPVPDLWPRKVGPRRPARVDQGLLPKPLEGRGMPGDQAASSQSLGALDHPTHGQLRPKGRVPPGLKSVTPR
jgi:hypothetical protein